MNQYETRCKMSGGSTVCGPLEAESNEDAYQKVLDLTPKVRRELEEIHPNETLESVEIYELVKVDTILYKPRREQAKTT